MVIYPLSARIPVKIADVTFWVAPLSWGQKQEILNCKKLSGGVEVDDNIMRTYLTLKFSIKQIDGLKNFDGTDYVLELGPDGNMTEVGMSDLMQIDQFPKLITTCAELVGKIRDIDADGVTVDLKQVRLAKKN